MSMKLQCRRKKAGPAVVVVMFCLWCCGRSATSFALFDVWMGRVRAAGLGRDGGLQGRVGEGFGRLLRSVGLKREQQ